MSQRDARIAPTAHYTADAWARLGLPHAEVFQTATGVMLHWALRASGEWVLGLDERWPSLERYLMLRHLSIERQLTRLEPDLVVELGAGLSRRGLTWAADYGVRYVEVDLPSMIALKRALLRRRAAPELRARAHGRLLFEPMDVLGPSFPSCLGALLHASARPVVIAEGLLGYFELPERARVAAGVAAALRGAGGGSFLTDLRVADADLAQRAAARALRGAIRLVTRGRGAGPDYPCLAAAEALFLGQGFTHAEPLPTQLVPEVRAAAPLRVWHARVQRAPGSA